MKKHLIISVIALAITASAFGANVVDKGGGGVPAAGGVGGGGKLPEAAQAVREVLEPHDAVSKLNDGIDKFKALLDGMQRGQDAVDRDTEHADGHERSATGKGDERPENPARSNAGRANDAHEAHDSHEVHVHEAQSHDHEPAARDHEPVVREGNAGRRS